MKVQVNHDLSWGVRRRIKEVLEKVHYESKWNPSVGRTWSGESWLAFETQKFTGTPEEIDQKAKARAKEIKKDIVKWLEEEIRGYVDESPEYHEIWEKPIEQEARDYG